MRRLTIALAAMLIFTALPAAVHAAVNTARISLNKVLPEAKFINIPINDAIDFLRDVSANIVVDWKAIEAVNISKDTQINLNLHQARLAKILTSVLDEAAPGDVLTYYTDENVIHITSRAVADAKLITIVYYVEDILDMNTPFDPTINVGGGNFASGGAAGGASGSSAGSGGASGNSGGGGGGLFGGSGGSGGSQQSNDYSATAQADRAKALIAMIQKTVRPDVWKENGGSAAIEFWNGNLIVTAPRSVQEAIGGPID